MSQPVFLRKSVAIATASLLQNLLPAVVIGASLYAILTAAEIQFDEPHKALLTLAIIMSLAAFRQPSNTGTLAMQWRIGGLIMFVLLRWGTILALLLAVGYISGYSEHFGRRIILPWAISVPILVLGAQLMMRSIMRRIVLSPENLRSAIIVGVNDPSIALADRIRNYPELCTTLLGFFDDRSTERLVPIPNSDLLGKLTDVPDYVKSHHVNVIFLALPIRHVKRVMTLLDEMQDSTVSIYYVPDVFVFDLIQSRTAEIMDIPVVAMCETPFYGYRGVMKRLTDLALAFLLLLAICPLMLLIAIAVKLDSSGPVLFRQRRYGLDGHEITVYKFRSMRVTEDGDRIAQATRGDPRITRIGRVLRRYSLDELPQLINVIQGRMSLVGPRPHAVAHNEEYRHLIKGYMVRHKVLPGITGLAQVNGCRGETAELEQMHARVQYDLEYLRRWTPLLDINILALTVIRAFRDSQAY